VSGLLDALARHAQCHPERVALRGRHGDLTYAALQAAVDALATTLDGRCLGLLADNGPAWLVADLAALRRGIPCVPLPTFFSPGQLEHVVRDAGIDLLLADRDLPGLLPGARHARVEVAGTRMARWRRDPLRPPPAGAAKVTYTSGTTGEPKGVVLGAAAQARVAASLAQACAARADDRTVSLLPLSTLLENLGVHAALLAGATATLWPTDRVGLRGAGGVDAGRLLAALDQTQPTTLILVPQLLQLLVELAEAGCGLPASLRFVAVGGAPVTSALLARAAAHRLPVYQGYGLSEAASVVTLNRPRANRPGSVGQPLAHAGLRISGSGEVLVRGALFDGYLGGTPVDRHGWWPTGDLGHLDGDGFLFLTGRRSSRFITAYGRNVSPEWVETELLADAPVAQALVTGEARPFNVALLVPRPGSDHDALAAGIRAVNARLPDYARITRFAVADEPFSVANGELTGSGRPRREAILARYGERLAALYPEPPA
jgi:long-subunit acyl-CoA synthetase (AMP-forming)